jgi:hypothetical protein
MLSHKPAPRGSSSKWQIEVDWIHHSPTVVPVNIFTEHGKNVEAWETVANYANRNNLTNTNGWKQFKSSFYSENVAKQAVNKKPTHQPRGTRYARLNKMKQRLNKDCREFFQVCLSAQAVANKAIHPDHGKLSEYAALLQSSDGEHWEESCCEEIGRLAQGYPPSIPNGTDTMHFIRFDQIPKGRKATYLQLVVADRPMKTNPRRVRFTVGGDQVNYPYDVSTKTAELTTAKILINSTISTPGARFLCMDIKDFYLNNPMSHYEYIDSRDIHFSEMFVDNTCVITCDSTVRSPIYECTLTFYIVSGHEVMNIRGDRLWV